ncbi:MAG: phosphoribosylaminoimidazolesuccinocarboxamide synthase [Clostridiales bacterium]|nr:phosphoribosylaminoimidazolesuccinocarboxamide synthase [Clostridiales bacterium]
MSVQQKEMIYEGKAKKVYNTNDKDLVIVSYKDDATAFNGVKKGTIVGKGVINNKMSNLIFKMLEAKGIPTHFVEEINDRDSIVKKVEIVKVEVIVRNIVAGSISKRLGLAEGTPLATTVLEYSYKNDELGDPMINDYHIAAMNLATQDEMNKIAEYAFKINEIMIEFFKKLNIKLIDFKIEFGRFNGEIILADEISPDTCRFWDADTNEKLDKDRFRRNLGNVEEAYEEVFRRLTGGDTK